MQDDAFLAAILAAPDDDAPRLIYADWLDEQGQPERAEFIRVQCTLARLPDGDKRREELEARNRALLAGHQEDWVQQFGVAMTWANTLTIFRKRLAETIAWCHGRSVRRLRTPSLKPATLLSQYVDVDSSGLLLWGSPSTREREATVNSLANRRTHRLADIERRLSRPPDDLGHGRLLLFDPDGTLSDGAATPESDGFFDGDNVPAWDTWVWYAGDRNFSQGGWTMFASYLVAWVPPQLLELADAGIRVNPEECIRWASDVDTALTRRLRIAGLLD